MGFLEEYYRIEETGQPIELAQYQRAVLRYVLQRDESGHLKFKTVIWSEPKKGGKTTISGGIIRWAAETWGRFGEIYCVGNDAKQAKERGFAKACQSIQLEPAYNEKRNQLPGRWGIQSKEATCLTTGTRVSAIASDYKGESGANPILSVWTEVWGIIHRDAMRFWAEMAPSPTRPDSIRWVESYAGYEGESELLWTLYDSTVNEGRQITAGEISDLHAFAEAPNADSLVPIFVDEAASIVAFWDTGDQAHRQPWQQGEHGRMYYANEAASQTPIQFDRLHRNLWGSAESSFIAIEWWDVLVNPLPLTEHEKTPLVIALDAAVSGDCFGMTVVSRDPERPKDSVILRASERWIPPPGGKLDYAPIWDRLVWFIENFNVVQICYDPYQLHDFCTRLQREKSVWCYSFSQGQERLISDSDLQKVIMERRIRHDGNPHMREHLLNANAKLQSNEDSKIRIVKKSDTRKIDLAVCLSMAVRECLRLNL